MNKRLMTAALAVVLLLVSASAIAAPVRKIFEIQRPLLSVPAIVKAGDAFPLELKLVNNARATGAELAGSFDPALKVKLSLENEHASGTMTFYSARVPADAPVALYDLAVTLDDGRTDRQPHSVKVVKEFKNEFDFVHLTDIHFNIEGRPTDRNKIRFQILDDISKLNPEFVIFSGDLALAPENYDRDYPFVYDAFVAHLNAPMYMVPGNHELSINEVNGTLIDGRDYWDAMYGPTYNSFDYDGVHMVGMCTYDWSPRWRDERNEEARKTKIDDFALIGPEQWDWLQKDFADAKANGKHILAHTHIPVDFLQGGRKVGAKDPEILEGPSQQKFAKFLSYYKVQYVYIGHMHMNSIRKVGDSEEVLTMGAGNSYVKDNERSTWGFRIVHVKDGVVTGMEVREYQLKDYPSTD